ncbi:MAG TPA: c-type cytochrome [Gemmatimonadota bacterium]|nr:c-type cytochrome [Gemmatimonadota bacterium]
MRLPARVAGPFLAALLLTPAAVTAQDAQAGKAEYDRWCAGCHGVDGKGDGPGAATMMPRPRDFTTGRYQIRSTPSGALPTDEDLTRVILDGMPGTAMPGWRDHFGEREMQELVVHLKSFSSFFESQPAPEPVEMPSAPGVDEAALAEGREFYEKIECNKCHGEAGRGDGPSAPTLEDDDDLPIRAADLTENWFFNGGGSVEEIHERLVTGLNGTPMPSFQDLIAAEFMTEDQLWHVAQYVRSLAPEEPPAVREVVRAGRVEGDLPASVDDAAWETAERFYVPLVGQVIVRPRWFSPTVDGVWVQALHNGRELAMRLVWHDPSESPDPDWDEWQAKVLALMAPADAPAESSPDTAATEPSTAASAAEGQADTTAVAAASPGVSYPDAFVVQFPRSIPDGMERPYFLMGDDRDPVYLWRWESGQQASEQLARGLARYEPLAGAQPGALTTEAVFDQGEWRLMLRRTMDAEGVTDRLAFEPGRAIPMALFAWDGSNGETGTQGAIGSWYFLYLDQPTASNVYVTPIVATLLTAALGVVVVRRAQRRARDDS